MPVDIFGPAIQAIQQNRANRLRDFQLEQAQKQVGREEEKRLALSEAPDFQTRIEALRRLGDVEAEQEMLNSEFARIGTLVKLDSKAAAQQYNRTIGRVFGNRLSPEKEFGDYSVFKLKDAEGTETPYSFDKKTGEAKPLIFKTKEGEKLNQKLIGEKEFKRADTLRDEFNALTKNFRVTRDAINNIEGLSSSPPSPIGDSALVFSLLKLLDPGSTVRETEKANVDNATNAPGWIRNVWNKIVDGTTLNDTQRKDLLARAQNLAVSTKKQFDEIADDYDSAAKLAGVDPNLVVLPSRRKLRNKKLKYNPATQRIE